MPSLDDTKEARAVLAYSVMVTQAGEWGRYRQFNADGSITLLGPLAR